VRSALSCYGARLGSGSAAGKRRSGAGAVLPVIEAAGQRRLLLFADCRPVDYRMAADGYEAKLDGNWVRVPDERVLHGQTNPTAHAIACRSPVNGSILCFVPASET
jgi:hypothetical protein